MAFYIEYKDDTDTYHIKHKDACNHCKHKTGNSVAVMKKIELGGEIEYSIKFKKIVTLSQLTTFISCVDKYVIEIIERR